MIKKMSARQVMFLQLFIIMLSQFISAENSYFITVPKTFRPGMTVDMNVLILNATEPVLINATFFMESRLVSSNISTFQQGVSGTLKLQIPLAAHDTGQYRARKLLITGSGGLDFNTSTHDIEFENKGLSIYIQTDKGVYKPGQTVKLRVLGVYPDLKMYLGKMTITVTDPKNNILAYWKDQVTPTGIVSKDFELTSQPNFGDWKITVQIEENEKEITFEVKEYVLPKFKVEIVAPQYLSSGNPDLKAIITAKYTYGETVKGSGEVMVTSGQHCDNDLCEPYKKLFKIDGPYTLSLSKQMIVDTFPDNFNPYDHNWYQITINVSITDELSKKSQYEVVMVPIFQSSILLKYAETNSKFFKPGFPFNAMVAVTERDDSPATGVKVAIDITSYGSETKKSSKTYIVDQDGYITIIEQIPENVRRFSIEGKAKDRHGNENSFYQHIDKFRSESKTFITVTAKSYEVSAGDEIECSLKSTEEFSEFYYMVLSRGNVLHHVTQMNTPSSKTASLKFSSVRSMAPTAKVVVYFIRDDGELIADSVTIKVNNPFENEVTVQFSSTEKEPGQDIDINIKADSGSNVALLAVDQSVLLMKKDNDLSFQQVMEELESYGGSSVWFPPWWRRRKRSFIPWYPSANDALGIFRLAGLVVLSDQRRTDYHGHPDDDEIRMEADSNGDFILNKGSGNGGLADVKRVRSFFPETWLWQTVPISSSGSGSLSTKVPDSITSWVLSGFAVSNDTGFSIANKKPMLKVFQPFFVSLDLPYSVIRGEEVAIKVIIFNYEETEMQVKVTLERSDNFENIIEIDNNLSIGSVSGDIVQVIKVPSNDGASLSFPVIPTALGAITITVKAQSKTSADAVKRVLIVEPEGVPQDYSYSLLLDFSDPSTDYSQDLPLSLPDNVVEGSAKGTITVIGDIMGSSINGIDQLLRMPYGCGEQNMVNFAPSMFIRAYLEAVGQLTQTIEDKTVRIMTQGYQRELIYEHDDGSYSAFGQRYGNKGSGSLWLTSFVVKSFSKASSYIYVDEKKIENSINFIIRAQQKDGSYKETGHVSSYLQGGLKSTSPEALSAYVVISLLETENDNADRSITKAISYLKGRLSSIDDTYTLTLLAYAFARAKENNEFDSVMVKLLERAVEDDGTMHWELDKSPASSPSRPWLRPYYHVKSADIEMTAYVLLAYSRKQIKEKALPIARWLAQQKNSLGGYSSTQDTVVGLQALSMFAPLVFTQDPNLNVKMQLSADPSYEKTIQVNKDNMIVLQEEELSKVAGSLKVSGNGNGMAVLQVGVTYNIKEKTDDNAFILNVVAKSIDNDHIATESCVKYNGDASHSGMAIMEVGLPTGFVMDQEQVEELLNDEKSQIRRIETPDRKAILYFDQISKTDEVCVTLNTMRQYAVGKSQDVPVKVYNYYKPDESVTTMYATQQDLVVCDVCQDCTNCKKRIKKPKGKGNNNILHLVTILFSTFIYYFF